MDYLVYLYYILLPVLFLIGVKGLKKGEWNDSALSFKQSKAILGFLAVIIVFHHCSQRTCAPWLDHAKIKHGLDLFVYVGYLCVAAFFFFSGYGMYTAKKTKPDFFSGYFLKRILPIFTPALIVWLVFFFTEMIRKVKVDSPKWINTFDYIWYIPAILYLYLLFFLCFRLIKNDRAGFIVLWVGVVFYMIICALFSPGTWWFNTVHLFAIGVGFARNEEKLIASFKKGYGIRLALSIIITLFAFLLASYYTFFVTKLNLPYIWIIDDFGGFFSQMLSAYTFVMMLVLIGMKVKIGNKVLSFLGTFTLELYLVHPFFVQAFGFAFVRNDAKPILYIKNGFLYVLLVLVCAIPIAYGLSLLTKQLKKLGSKKGITKNHG